MRLSLNFHRHPLVGPPILMLMRSPPCTVSSLRKRAAGADLGHAAGGSCLYPDTNRDPAKERLHRERQPSLWPMVASCRCKILGQITKTCLRYFPVSLTRVRALSAALCAGFYSLRSLSDIRQSDFKHAAIACSGVSAEAPAHSDETASSHGASVSEISGKVWWALRG
jgi:hypothetical protein